MSGLNGVYTDIFTFEGSFDFGTSPLTIMVTLKQITDAEVTGTFLVQGAAAARFANSYGTVKGTLGAAGESGPSTFKAHGIDFEGDPVFVIDTTLTAADASAFAGTCGFLGLVSGKGGIHPHTLATMGTLGAIHQTARPSVCGTDRYAHRVAASQCIRRNSC